jgi:cell division protein FtsA
MSSLSQRSAVEERKPVVRAGAITAIDIGASKIAAFVGQRATGPGPLKVAGVGVSNSGGVANGMITDIEATSRAIHNAVRNAEAMAQSASSEAVVSVSGFGVRSETAQGMINVPGGEVTTREKRKVVGAALQRLKLSERSILHATPRFFTVDGNPVREPQAMICKQLGVVLTVVTAPTIHWRNLHLCVERANLNVIGLVAAPYAASLAALSDDEMESGALVIDMGARSTTAALFHNGALAHVDAIPIGADSISQDIAHGFSTSLSMAEKLKVMHGSAIAHLADDTQMVDVTQINELGETVTGQIPRALLTGIIRPRVEEMLELLRDRLVAAGIERPGTGRRVVLTGGGANLNGVRELASKVLESPVRIGRPQRYTGLGDAVCGPAFSVPAGLLRWGVAPPTDLAQMASRELVEPATPLQKAVQWMRDHW